jgi:hypothetical protein
MKSFLFAAALLFNLPAMAQSYDLFFKNGTVQATATFAEAPVLGKPNAMTVEFKDAVSQIPLAIEDQFAVVLWMPDMGHGSRPVKINTAVDASGNTLVGVYAVTKMYFVMGGLWEVRVSLKDAAGNVETQIFNVEF